jgi:hypothetical protein
MPEGISRPTAPQLASLLRKRATHWLTSPQTPHEHGRRDGSAWHAVHAAILEVTAMLNRPGWSSYLVGGTLRDLLVGPDFRRRRVQPRDVDIVVGGATREQLRELFSATLVLERLTRFGGLHLARHLPSGYRVVFDVWTLADTWGFGSKNIPPTIEEFPGTTFMNIDSCAMEIWPLPGKPRALFEQGFFEGIANRVVDLNYAPNPYPFVCVARALVMAARLQFALTRPIAEFILSHTAAGVEPLIEAQLSHYGIVRCPPKELEAWIHDIRSQYTSGKSLIGITVPRSRQLELWRDYPAAGDTRDASRSEDRNLTLAR